MPILYRPDKVCCLSLKIWWILISVLCTVYTILKIIVLALPLWIYQGTGEKYWEGNLISVTKSGKAFENRLYSLISEELCHSYYNGDYSSAYLTISELSTLCNEFQLISTGIPASIAFSILSITCLIMMILVLKCAWSNLKLIGCTVCLSVVGIICEFLSLVIFVGVTKITFSGDCSYFDSISTNKICAEYGAALEVALSIFILLSHIAFWVFNCMLNAKSKVPPIPPINNIPLPVPILVSILLPEQVHLNNLDQQVRDADKLADFPD